MKTVVDGAKAKRVLPFTSGQIASVEIIGALAHHTLDVGGTRHEDIACWWAAAAQDGIMDDAQALIAFLQTPSMKQRESNDIS